MMYSKYMRNYMQNNMKKNVIDVKSNPKHILTIPFKKNKIDKNSEFQ